MKSIFSLATLVAAASAAAISSSAASASGSGSPSSVAATAAAAAASSGSCPASSAKPSGYWMDEIVANAAPSALGSAPYANTGGTYVTYKNVVRDYHAVADGSGDQTGAIQSAIDDNGNGGSRQYVTVQPRQVYLPPGTYALGSTLNLKMGTIIVGDPASPPTLKASAGFNGNNLVNGYDDATGHPEDSFMTLLKNVILDTTAISASTQFTALEWGVAQGCGLSNVVINMPSSSTGQTGINLSGGSTVVVADVKINGGATGISNSNQQVNFKNIAFTNCTVGYQATGGWTALLQSPTWNTCGTGAKISSTANLAIVDGTSTNSGTVVVFDDSSSSSGSRNNQIYIQNLVHDTTNAIAQTSSGNVALAAQSHVDTWFWGNETPGGYQKGGNNVTTSPPAGLMANSKFLTVTAPTYANYAAADVVNVKGVAGHTVKGDGKTDDSASINAILASAAQNCQVVFFPAGVYVVENTITVPANSRLVGESFAAISGSGSKFNDATNPVPVVQVGSAGDTGVAQISDMRFTVSSPLAGAIILQWNLAGGAQGDSGLWNSVVTIGGTAGSTVTTTCQNQDTSKCMAAYLGLHIAPSAGVYVENVWVWTADHAFDGVGGNQIISTHGGVLVEATHPTWLMGLASEHHWLFNVNIHGAQSLYAGLIQTETPYMQGSGAVQTVPSPWTASAAYGDPDYSWCAAGDQKCRTALSVNVDGGSGNVFLYGSASWAFFAGPWNGEYNDPCSGSCQTNMNRVANVTDLVWAQVNGKSADVLVLDGKSNPATVNYPGSWGGIIDAYEQFRP